MKLYKVMQTSNRKPVATLWYDGKKIQSDSKSFLNTLRERPVANTSVDDGEEYLEHLDFVFKNGYYYVEEEER